MSACSHIQHQFSRYLDGDVPGAQMLEIGKHLDSVRRLRRASSPPGRRVRRWSRILAPRKCLRTSRSGFASPSRRRAAIRPRERLGRFQSRWENTFQPFLLRAAAGFASAIFLVGTAAMLVGNITSPEPVEARDVPLQVSTAPRLLYSSFQPADEIGDHNNPVVLQVFVDGHGRVYDYKVLSGQVDAQARESIDNLLLFSVFAPARSWDQPVRGTTVMSFSGISVKG